MRNARQILQIPLLQLIGSNYWTKFGIPHHFNIFRDTHELSRLTAPVVLIWCLRLVKQITCRSISRQPQSTLQQYKLCVTMKTASLNKDEWGRVKWTDADDMTSLIPFRFWGFIFVRRYKCSRPCVCLSAKWHAVTASRMSLRCLAEKTICTRCDPEYVREWKQYRIVNHPIAVTEREEKGA
jgi:hypothetical protein